MPQIENENTFLQALTSQITLYLGAGFSVLAKDKNDVCFPVGDQLKTELISEFSASDYSSLELPQIASILESTRRSEFEAYIRERFRTGDVNKKYRVLRRMSISSIFTVNVDDLAPRIFDHASPFYLQDITQHGPAKSAEAIPYIPLHGCILNKDQPLTFSSVDIASSSSYDADRWRFLTTMLQRAPILFWGTKLVDGGVLTALNAKAIEGRTHQPKWMVLRDSNKALETYYQSLGFSIIISDTENLLDYLDAKLPANDPARKVLTNRNVRSLFPENSIPPPFSVPVRPMSEFFAGAEPTWHDIFSGQVPKTTHFSKVLDLANAKKDGAVIGMPFSGKTTLLMQVAHEMSGDRYKIIFDGISAEQADSVASRLSGEPAIAFVDNFADSLDGYLELRRHKNIQVIGFDRDINYEIVSHLIDPSGLELISISDLVDTDLQSIFDKLPNQIRAESFNRPEPDSGASVSLFDFIESNIKFPSLKERISSLLSGLRESRRDLYDLFLMFCYVTECRTPVSLDMLWAYLDGSVHGYNAIIQHVKTLGSMIAELSENAASNLGLTQEQDYFQIRSRILSSAVIQETSGVDLRSMLDRFHSSVSPYRIVRFDVFRKTAYQSRIIHCAFPDAEEGKMFYEDAYNRQPNHYLLQQGAIYLSARGKFKEAFRWIDQAIQSSQGKVLSIQNTHAMILFRANIKASGDEETIRRTLEDSMKILGDLYWRDARKNYHVGTYSTQALEFWYRYRDSKGISYLKTAEQWLKSELVQSHWSRFLKRTLRQVQEVLTRES